MCKLKEMDTDTDQSEQLPVRISKLTGKPVQSRHYKNGTGAPSTYKPEYAQMMIDFFSCPEVVYEESYVKGKDGVERAVKKPVANRLPLFQEFAVKKLNSTPEIISRWAEKYPDFAQAYKKSKLLQEAHLIQNGIRGRYDTAFGIFVAKNITSLRDKVDVDIQQDIHIDVIGYDPEALPETRKGKQLPKAEIIDV